MMFAFDGNAVRAENARTVFDYTEPRVQYTNLAVSRRALDRSDVERWGEILDASEAQLQTMLAEYAAFVEEHNALLDREAPRLLAASAEIQKAREEDDLGEYTDDHVSRMRSLIGHASQLRRQMEQVEQAYINSLEPFLAASQVDRLQLLRNEATRRHCRVPATVLPWADVDVRTLWDQVDDARLSPEDLEWIGQILWEHDQQLTPMLRAMTDTYWRGTVAGARRVVDLQSGRIGPEEYVASFERGRQPFLRSLLRIGMLNESTVSQIVEFVPESIGSRFLLIAKAAAYPAAYPDSSSLHTGFRSLIHDEGLESDQVEIVERFFESYSLEYEQLADELERFYLEWGQLNVLGRTGHFNQDLPQALEPKLERRRELADRWVVRLAESVDEELLVRNGLKRSDEDEGDDVS